MPLFYPIILLIKDYHEHIAGIVVRDDGNAILHELDVPHRVATSMFELSCTQDREVGDGTTFQFLWCMKLSGKFASGVNLMRVRVRYVPGSCPSTTNNKKTNRVRPEGKKKDET